MLTMSRKKHGSLSHVMALLTGLPQKTTKSLLQRPIGLSYHLLSLPFLLVPWPEQDAVHHHHHHYCHHFVVVVAISIASYVPSQALPLSILLLSEHAWILKESFPLFPLGLHASPIYISYFGFCYCSSVSYRSQQMCPRHKI